jgi:hypothetical protein
MTSTALYAPVIEPTLDIGVRALVSAVHTGTVRLTV